MLVMQHWNRNRVYSSVTLMLVMLRYFSLDYVYGLDLFTYWMIFLENTGLQTCFRDFNKTCCFLCGTDEIALLEGSQLWACRFSFDGPGD